MTPEEIRAFQSTRADWHGVRLVVDGNLGPKTQWALDLRACGTERERIVRTAQEFLTVVEEPLGSNRAPLIDLMVKPAGIGFGHPWCAAFVSFVLRECRLSLAKYHVSVHEMVALNPVRNTTAALPGDVFYILRNDGTGHTGFIIGGDAHELMTLEGNCQNRVMVGRRERSKIQGIIDTVPSAARMPAVSGTVPDLDGAEDR